MEVGGTAPGLPGPEALEVEWSSSSSEESPVYATKPVFNLFTVGSGRRGGKTHRREEEAAHLGREGEKVIWGEEKKKQNNSNNMFQIRQVKVNYSKHILGETNS